MTGWRIVDSQVQNLFRSLLLSRNLHQSVIRPRHDSLDSFLHYARTQGLGEETTYYVGTVYEYVVQRALSTCARMSLEHLGGAGDRGIDLRGSMAVPKLQRDIPVIVQCKYEQKKPGARHFRELEGCLASENQDTLAILVAHRPITAQGKRVLGASDRPMAFCLVSGYDSGGVATQFIWNKPSQALLQGLRVTNVYRETEVAGETLLLPSIAVVDI